MEDQENNNSIINGNDMQERKQCYRNLLNKIEDISESNDVGLQTVKKLKNILRQANVLNDQCDIQERIQCPEEILLDSFVVSSISNVLVKCTKAVNVFTANYESADFASKIVDTIKTDEEIAQLDFIKLLEDARDIIPNTLEYSFLYGTFDVSKLPEPKVKKQRVKEAQERVAKKELVAIKSTQTDNEVDEDAVMFLLKVLQDEFKTNHERPLKYYDFIMDTRNYSLTVENMFYCSFLIRDGKAKLSIDERGVPTIKPASRKDLKHFRQNNGSNTQMIMSIDLEEWDVRNTNEIMDTQTYPFENFINNLYICLTGVKNKKTSIIRIHTRNLEQSGELSFPLSTNNWYSLIGKNIPEHITILQLNNNSSRNDVNKLITDSKSWTLHIDNCEIVKGNVQLYLDKETTFQTCLKQVCDKNASYGAAFMGENFNFIVNCDASNKKVESKLSDLRLQLLEETTKNLICYCGGTVLTENKLNTPVVTINLSLKPSNIPGNFVCGAVLNNQGVKDVTTTADDFYKTRTMDMRLMAEHKYGLRITSQPGWATFFEKLGNAAVVIELLRNKPNQTVMTDMNNQLLSSSKGAAFILYNCARLAKLFKEFDKRVSSHLYANLPDFEEIDFSLLTQQEEWELLYIHVLQFPQVIKNCTRDILISKIYPNCLVAALSSMCLCFSVYYRRVKILIEPKPHMFPTLYARIYLLKAVEQVLHNGLKILNITPVKQM